MTVWPHFNLMMRLEGLPPFEELTCLDLGCGAYNSDVAKQVLECPWKVLTSIDGYQPDLDSASTKPCVASKWVRKLADVKTAKLTPHDIVVAFDVLEHMTHEDGEEWLLKVERAAKNRVVLFLPIEPDDFHRIWTQDTNGLQEHLSHWKAHEMENKGYTVEVINDCHTEARPDGSTVSFGAMWCTKNIV